MKMIDIQILLIIVLTTLTVGVAIIKTIFALAGL